MGVAGGIVRIVATPAVGGIESEGIILLAKSDLLSSVGIVGAGAAKASADPIPRNEGGDAKPPGSAG